MSNIVGNKQIVDAARNAPSTDKTIMINFDLIEQLPEEWEAVASEVKFDIKADFADIGNGNLMPNPDLMYKIAEAKGIKGGEKSMVNSVIEDVDMSEITLDGSSGIKKIVVGYRVTKYSTVIEEDGTERRSSACTSEYNVWNRCSELWAKEEMYTEGYTKPPKYPPNKYNSRWKRQANFKSELKFAQAKAETKAHLKSIRELAGMMTGYKAADLKSGHFIFVKIRRSSMIQKMETAARLQAISRGITDNTPADLLFGSAPSPEPTADPLPPDEYDFSDVDIVEDDPQIPPNERFVNAMEFYLAEKLHVDSADKMTARMIAYFSDPKHTDDDKLWPKSINRLKAIEATIDPAMLYSHDLY